MKSRMLNLILGTGIFMILAAPSISFDAKMPAYINLPGHIKSVALIDRSPRENKVINVIEGVITGERIGQDNIAARVCLDGLYNQLTNSGKLEVTRTNIHLKGAQTAIDFAQPLPWNEVSRICKEYSTDALLSLEFFDTDYVGNEMKAKVGFRIYDPVNKIIVDQFVLHHGIVAHPRNPDFINLLSGYVDQDAIKSLSYEAGIIYGQRISPYWERITRIYYNKPRGDKNLAFGSRMMEVNDWDSAIPALNEAVNKGKRKVQGRAAHNLAVIHEILGDYSTAREWAQKAWGIYKNKDSKEYTYILNQRIREIESLRGQMGE